MGKVMTPTVSQESDLKKCGWLGRSLYCVCDVNYISQLAHVHTILSSGIPPTQEEIDSMRIVVKDIIDVILEDNADSHIRSVVLGS